MTDVKRYDCTNGGYRHCQGCYEMTETPLGDYVRSEDYDALAAEAQALREEVDQQKFLIKVENDALQMMTAKANELKSEVEQLEEELEALRARVVAVPDAANDRRKSAHYCRGWNACLDELARLNGMTVSVSALDTLRKAALGEVQHLNNGLCPDAFEGHEARDPDCPVCRALIETGKESDNV